MLIDQLILSERKSITLTIESDGMLVVRAPTRLSQAEIQRFVDEQADWVAPSI
jgi:predicted metal-dependent hydrolase